MICDNCIHNAVCEREHFENHCGYKHTEADVIVPELEEIKAEIEEKEFKLNCATMSDVALKMAYTEVAKLLDKHISELKGENK